MPLTLEDLGRKGQEMSTEAEESTDSPSEWLDGFIPGLGPAAVEYWTGLDPVEAYCAGLITGLIVAKEGSDDA